MSGIGSFRSCVVLRIALLLVVCSVCRVATAGNNPYDDQTWSRLDAGEIVLSVSVDPMTNGRRRLAGVVVAIIDTPPHRVWETILDHDRYSEFMPYLQDCTVVEDNGLSRIVFYQVSVGWTVITYYLLLSYDPSQWLVEGALDKTRPHQIADTHCVWKLEPLDGGIRTIASYSVTLDTGRQIPYLVEQLLVSWQLPHMMENVRQRAVSGGTWMR